jgi:hypothetical protein
MSENTGYAGRIQDQRISCEQHEVRDDRFLQGFSIQRQVVIYLATTFI